MRIRAAVTAALLASTIVACQATTATAAPHRENVLRGFCAASVQTSCVSVMDDDEGILQVRDRRGHRVNLRSSTAALRYLRHHAPACRLEDSPRCYWDAGHSGNGVGDSFITVGARSVFYLGGLD